MQDPVRYFSTPAVNEFVALHAATQIVLAEGLAVRFERHRRIARAFRRGFQALGLELFTAPECRAETLSVVNYPDRVDDAEFRKSMASHGVVVAGALGPIAGRAFRVGHMGNIGAAEVYRTLEAIEKSLAEQGGKSAGAAEAARGLLD